VIGIGVVSVVPGKLSLFCAVDLQRERFRHLSADMRACQNVGKMKTTAQGDIVDPVQSPGMGVWQYQAGRVFALSFKTLWYESQGDAAGSLIGIATIRSTSTVSEFSLVDTQGNVLLETQGTWQFTDIKIVPLQ